MKDKVTQLYPNEEMSAAVSEYALKHSTELPVHITALHELVDATHEKSNYMISPLQAQFHVWITKALSVKRVLEIGTFIGFSTMCWAEAVGPSGHVTTLEFSPEYASQAKKVFEGNHLHNVRILVGDARDTLKTLAETLDEPFDLIFIDADKPSYPAYLALILSLSAPSSTTTRLLRPGGIILADNILRSGLVVDKSPTNPYSGVFLKGDPKHNPAWKESDLTALNAFNKAMAISKRIDAFLMPLFDGLGCGRLLD